MTKKNPLSDLSKKFDLGGIVKNVKTMINPMSQTPDVDIDDPLGVKMAQISMMIQKCATLHGEQKKMLEQTNTMVNELYTLLESIRNLEGEEQGKAKEEEAAEDTPVASQKPPEAQQKEEDK